MCKLKMFKRLSQATYDINMAATEVNTEVLKQMAGNVGEHIVADMVGGQVASRDGFDVFSLKETTLSNAITIRPGDRIEVKTAVIQTNGKCVAYSLGGKESNCEYLALVDMTDDPDNIRVSIIPSDIFFDDGKLTKVKGVNDRFSWSGTYEIKRPGSGVATNTNMFLEYEVKK